MAVVNNALETAFMVLLTLIFAVGALLPIAVAFLILTAPYWGLGLIALWIVGVI